MSQQALISQMLESIAGDNNDLQNHSIQKSIIDLLQKVDVSLEAFKMIKRFILCYGLGVLIFLQAYFGKLNDNTFQYYQEELGEIQIIVRGIIDNSFTSFSELNFLKFSSICQSKSFKRTKKNDSNLFQRLALENVVKRSNRFRRHLIKIKQIFQKIKKIETESQKQVCLLLDKYYLQLCCQQEQIFDGFNYLQLRYHLIWISKIMLVIKEKVSNYQFESHARKQINTLISVIYSSIKAERRLKQFKIKIQEEKSKTPKINNKTKSINQIEVIEIDDPQDISEWKCKKQITEKHPKLRIVDSCENNQSKQIPLQLKANIVPAPTNPFAPHLTTTNILKLCCRTSFLSGQMIQLAQSLQRQYKDYHLPLKSNHIQIIKKTMVGFLNSVGGIIYIGIKQQSNRIRRVVGVTLTETQKQNFLFAIRQLSQQIQPDIITNGLYAVKFVPMRSSKNQHVMAGKYVVKIIVKMGRDKELYSYINSQGYYTAFRTQNEVLGIDPKKDFKRIYQIIKQRQIDPPKKIIKQHQGQCPQPEQGLPFYSYTE